jgi:RNA polymerase sigma-70 factor (ECF subfamily)
VAGDGDLVARLRAGDERAFATLVDQYHSSLIRLAATYVPSRAVAEEVVQDTWLGVLQGIDRFEGRSSVKTWLFRILVNRARSTGPRERRTVSLDDGDATVDPRRFGSTGHWVDPPAPWTDDVEDRLMAAGIVDRVRVAVDALPAGQRQVVVLRDVEGLSSIEVCSVLGISEGNQRVLLHRGRSRVRRGFEHERSWSSA